jgi:hypothetical protein
MEFEELKSKLIKSIDKLTKNDSLLLEININERTLSGRLAFYLQEEFSKCDYDVDCEYNRFNDDIKRLPQSEPIESNDTKGKTIFPDIIIHKRGTQENNLCLIEIKKENNSDIKRDIEKLTKLTTKDGGYHYDYGFHLTFGNTDLTSHDIYQNGKKTKKTL